MIATKKEINCSYLRYKTNSLVVWCYQTKPQLTMLVQCCQTEIAAWWKFKDWSECFTSWHIFNKAYSRAMSHIFRYKKKKAWIMLVCDSSIKLRRYTMFALIYQDERFLKTLHLTKRQLSEVPTFVYTQTSSLFFVLWRTGQGVCEWLDHCLRKNNTCTQGIYGKIRQRSRGTSNKIIHMN